MSQLHEGRVVTCVCDEEIKVRMLVTPSSLHLHSVQECGPLDWMYGVALEDGVKGQVISVQLFEMQPTAYRG